MNDTNAGIHIHRRTHTPHMLRCVAVCCGMLQCVAVCFDVLRCVAVCCSMFQCVAACCSALQWGVYPSRDAVPDAK